MGEGDELAPLAPWLAERLGDVDDMQITGAARPGSGFSAETVVFDAAYLAAGERRTTRFVLRRESPDPPVYPVQVPGWAVAIELQYRIMDALQGQPGVPVAPLLGYEADPSVLGAPFFVMDFVAGDVPIESPPYTTAGFFLDASPQERRQLVARGLETVAALHAVDWRAVGLDWLVRPGRTPDVGAQLDLWEDYATAELRGRHHPGMAEGFAWLRAHPPTEGPPVLCWGDPRPGNMIWQGAECRCVTDFEAASIAPAELDLGWWLMFDRSMHEAVGADRLPGEPTRDEQRALYAAAAGRDVGATTWWEVCAATRYAAIVARVMNRAVDRGLMPPDQTIWLHNPAATCLDQLLAER